MSVEHVFIDTNILVYAHDADAGDRHLSAVALIKMLWDRPYPPAISTQVLQEFIATLFKKGVSRAKSREIVQIYYDWEIVPHTVGLTQAAIDIWERYKTSWWDALIIAAAQAAHTTELWSENLQSGQTFDSVKIVNPLECSP